MIRDLAERPFLHERNPDAPEVIVSTPLRFIRVVESSLAVLEGERLALIPAQVARA